MKLKLKHMLSLRRGEWKNNEIKKKLMQELNEAKTRLAEQKYGNTGSDSTEQRYRQELKEAQEKLADKQYETHQIMKKAQESQILADDLLHSLKHLTEKLERVKMDREEESTFKKSDITSDTSVEAFFERSKARIEKLFATLPNNDELEVVLEKSRTDDVYLAALETRMPSQNTRLSRLGNIGISEHDAEGLKQKSAARSREIDNDSESGEDDNAYISREQMKKNSSQLIDSKSKKRTNRKRSTNRKRY